MSVIGFHGDLRWRLKNAEFWLDTAPTAIRQCWEAAEDQSRQPAGIELTWADMEQLASDCSQVIDGTFTGYSGSLPRLQIAVIRSSYWIVWTVDETVVSWVRGGFRGVTDYDEPAPPPLEIPSSASVDRSLTAQLRQARARDSRLAAGPDGGPGRVINEVRRGPGEPLRSAPDPPS